MRHSKQRNLILESVKNNALHLTADGVYDIVRKEVFNISLGTVYRNLLQLVESNQILKISIPGQPDRYDGNLIPHAHFLCTKCDQVFDIFDDNLLLIENMIKNHLNAHIDTIEVSSKGICQTCN